MAFRSNIIFLALCILGYLNLMTATVQGASDEYYVLAEMSQGNSTASYAVINLNPIKMVSGPDESLAEIKKAKLKLYARTSDWLRKGGNSNNPVVVRVKWVQPDKGSRVFRVDAVFLALPGEDVLISGVKVRIHQFCTEKP